MCTGPVIRAAGVPYDIRKAYPYLGYETYQFDVPIQHTADCYGRYQIRMAEMKESASLVLQALDRLKPGTEYGSCHSSI